MVLDAPLCSRLECASAGVLFPGGEWVGVTTDACPTKVAFGTKCTARCKKGLTMKSRGAIVDGGGAASEDKDWIALERFDATVFPWSHGTGLISTPQKPHRFSHIFRRIVMHMHGIILLHTHPHNALYHTQTCTTIEEKWFISKSWDVFLTQPRYCGLPFVWFLSSALSV